MSASLFSSLWYRVAQLRPQLRSHVRVQRQRYRDQLWHLLIDGATGRQHRINDAAYQFVGRCNGERSVQQVWDGLLDQFGDEAPTQNEVVQVLTQLAQSDLLQCEVTPDVEILYQHQAERTRRERRAWLNPLAFRLPLADPSHLLDRLHRYAGPLFHPHAFALWVMGMLFACLVASSHWTALQSHALVALQTPRHLMLAWLCFPFIKALHELGHALAVRHWGGRVTQTGITLLLLTPAPYVDASAATAFRHRYQRVAVSAAGMIVELALAAAALFVWLNAQPGLIRDIAFVTMLIGGITTVLFNANPLVRFDGYYILCDVLDIPNLAMRSRAWWCALLRKLAGVESEAALQPAAGERKWLLAYAPVSWLCRVLISIATVQWIGHTSSLLGWIAAVVLLIVVVIVPALRITRDLLNAAGPGRASRRARIAVAGAIFSLVLVLAVIPVPLVTVAQGVVWLPEQSRVRAETDGFIVKVRARDGSRVERGQLLLELSNPQLDVERERLESSLGGLYAEQYQAMLLDPVQALNAKESIARTRAELGRIEERIRQLQVRSQETGRLVLPHETDLVGAFVRQGASLGYVLTSNDVSVRTAVPEQDAALVRDDTRRIDLRFAEDMTRRIDARLERDLPAATNTLPSTALGDRFGGALVTDPNDKEGLRTQEPIALIDITVPGKLLNRAGGLVWVRFDHGAQPLLGQWYRRLNQLFLQNFDPTSSP